MIAFHYGNYNNDVAESSQISTIGYDCSLSYGSLICKEKTVDPYNSSTIPAIRMFYKEDSLYKTFATNTEEFYNNYSVYLEDSNGTLTSYDPANIDQFEIWVYAGNATIDDGCGGKYPIKTYTSSFDNHTYVYEDEQIVSIEYDSDSNKTSFIITPLLEL